MGAEPGKVRISGNAKYEDVLLYTYWLDYVLLNPQVTIELRPTG